MSHHHDPNQPFLIPQIRFIPEKLKLWLVILFIIVFNCTGGVYLAAVSEMVGSTQLLQEDIMMAGYASLVGMVNTMIGGSQTISALPPHSAWLLLVLTCTEPHSSGDLLLAPSHICEHALMEGVLRYDHANVMTLNWISVIGVIIGILFTWQTFARRKWTYQNMLVIERNKWLNLTGTSPGMLLDFFQKI